MTIPRIKLRSIMNEEMRKIIREQEVAVDTIVMDPLEIKGSGPPPGLEGSEEASLVVEILGALTPEAYEIGEADNVWYQASASAILEFLEASQDANSLTARNDNVIRSLTHYLKSGDYPVDEKLLLDLVDDALEVARSTLGSRVQTRIKENRFQRNTLLKAQNRQKQA